MDFTSLLKEYDLSVSIGQINKFVEQARAATRNSNESIYKACHNCIDLTSLNISDNATRIKEFAGKVMAFNDHYPDIPNVASVCVYPNFVDTVGVAIGDSGIRITSVAGGFPTSQTYLEVKMLEVAMAVENGADEVDIVMNVGQFQEGEYEQMCNEIDIIREEVGSDVTLKVIIESGSLADADAVRRASLLAMLAGADFVKTSTGKAGTGATPEAAAVICCAIKDFYQKTGKRVGFKAAGGIRTAQDAAMYYSIVNAALGKEWLTPALLRIGTSSAANSLISAIIGKEVTYY